MERYGYVYKVTNKVNNMSYIGKHKPKENEKFDDYLGSGYYILRAIHKWGKENFTKVIIDWGYSLEDLNEKEKFWISFYDAAHSKEFYNVAEGGDGGSYWDNYSEERKAELRAKMSKIYHSKSDEEKAKIRELLKKRAKRGKDNYFYGKHMCGKDHPRFGVRLTQEQKHHLSIMGKKYKPTQETLEKQRMTALTSEKCIAQRERLHSLPDLGERISNGLKNSEKFQKAVRENNKKKRIAVDQFTKDGKFIRTWESIKAARRAGYCESSIQYCIKGKMKTSAGCIWKVHEEP